MKVSKVFLGLSTAVVMATGLATAGQAQSTQQSEVAATPPTFLRLEITSACTTEGAVFKVINRGDKWPRTGFLRLFYADSKQVIGERRLRLAPGQKVSFVVKSKIMNGRPVAVYVEPEWYKREMEYDASIQCSN